MTDRSILFSAPMIRALLEGRKTQTRRVIKRHALHKPEPHSIAFNDGKLICRWRSGLRHDIPSPYALGDRLWVREHVRFCSQVDRIKPSELSQHEPRVYVADNCLYEPACMMIEPGKLRPGMFMPRWANRLTLIVTDVRVQRLQEISEVDAISEGVEPSGSRDQEYSEFHARKSFESLWNNLNAERGYGWDANPWVCAVTFTVHQQNIDQMEAA